MKAIYIDVQNVHRKTKDYGRVIDRQKFYIYLRDKYQPDNIYYAVGYVAQYKGFYDELERIGYVMIFKKTTMLPDGSIKGNVDIDIAIKSIYDLWKNSLTKAYIITNDGDYNTLIEKLTQEQIFGGLIVPDDKTSSRLLTGITTPILDIQRIKHIIQKQKDSPQGESN